ncbi:DsrE family protein [Wohlfahrtiimonas sp. G9077]|uniref:DsrE family protein n=1 Tax=Wohlfahrtiimonas sp. G9077 TaxID=1980118 RepID=UPI000B98134A|nr:DsrE family protein [Wohlfahrtiimonas sp. G9077]OYQ74523.1 hypothetical protein B9T20_04455 [Wohlfahrtiimonas sp. G9077]
MADLLITLTQHESNANNVTIAFTMGNEALNKGYSVDIVLLSDAVALAQQGYDEKIDIGAPFKALRELLPAFLQAGGKLKVCKACMIHNGVKEEDLLKDAIIITALDVIDLLMESKKSLQLN